MVMHKYRHDYILAEILNFLIILDWGGYVSEASMPFILIVGSFRPEQVTEILEGFLNTVKYIRNNLLLMN